MKKSKEQVFNEIRQQFEYNGYWLEAGCLWREAMNLFPLQMEHCFYQWEACIMLDEITIKRKDLPKKPEKFKAGEMDEEWQRRFASDILSHQNRMLEKRRLVCLISDIIDNGNLDWRALYFWAERKLKQVKEGQK